MKKSLVILAAFGALSLSACETVPTVSAVTNVCANTQRDEQLWYAAEALYNVPAAAYRSANERRLISASLKATIRPKLQTLNRYRIGARSAYQACDLVALGQYSDAMTVIRNEVMPLIPGR